MSYPSRLLAALELVDVDRLRRGRQRDRLVPSVEGDLAAAAAALGDRERIGGARRRDVERSALRGVRHAHGLLAADRRGGRLGELAVAAERRFEQLAEVGELREG